MNKEEFLEKYGDALVRFSSYNDYLFTFSTEDGIMDIYFDSRSHVSWFGFNRGQFYSISDLVSKIDMTRAYNDLEVLFEEE